MQADKSESISPLSELAEDTDNDVFDVDKALNESYINPQVREPLPEIVIYVKGERFATLGNFSTIIGKSKSGKSTCVLMMIADITGGNSGVFSGSLNAAIFDTEQSRGDIQNIYIDKVKAMGGDPLAFDCFSIKKWTPDERQQIIDNYIKKNPQTKLIVIDGIRDLLTDINSPEQSTYIASWLMKLVDEYNIHIVNVIHQNKTDNNARGHIGSELNNKSETVLSVTKNADNVIQCSPELTRAKPFDEFVFSIDENGLPEVDENYKKKIEDEKRKTKKNIMPADIEYTAHIDILKSVFNGVPQNYNDTWRKIKLQFNKQLRINFGDNKAKDFLTYYIDEGMILKTEKSYQFNTNHKEDEPLY